MLLEQLWEKYKDYKYFNINSLPEELIKSAVRVNYEPKAIITLAGDSPTYIYFLESGTAQGLKMDDSGNCYHYFVIRKKEGSIGLLEVLSHERAYIATIIAMTPISVLRVESALVYKYIMDDINLLRCCLHSVSHDLYLRSANDGLLYYRSGLDRVKLFITDYYLTNSINKNTIVLQTDYQTIANNIGASLRTVGRSIQQLKELSLVTSYKKKITISFDQYEKMLADL